MFRGLLVKCKVFTNSTSDFLCLVLLLFQASDGVVGRIVLEGFSSLSFVRTLCQSSQRIQPRRCFGEVADVITTAGVNSFQSAGNKMNISHCFYKNCHSNFYCCQRLLSCVSKPLNVNRCQPINSFTLTGSQNCKRNVLNINVSFFHRCAFSCLQLHSQCGGGGGFRRHYSFLFS